MLCCCCRLFTKKVDVDELASCFLLTVRNNIVYIVRRTFEKIRAMIIEFHPLDFCF